MKNLTIFTILLFVFCYAASITAAPTITFYPSDGTTLTRQDVDNTLTAHGLTRDSEFHAVIEVAEKTNREAFAFCIALLSVYSSSVIDIGAVAFSNCTNLTSIHFPKIEQIQDSVF